MISWSWQILSANFKFLANTAHDSGSRNISAWCTFGSRVFYGEIMSKFYLFFHSIGNDVERVLQVQGALQAIEEQIDDKEQIISAVVDSRPGRILIARRSSAFNFDGRLPESPISFHLSHASIVSLTFEATAAENVHLSVEDSESPISDIVTHADAGRPALRAVARLAPGSHNLTIRCSAVGGSNIGWIQGPSRLEVRRYPAAATQWRETLPDGCAWHNSALLECGYHVEGGSDPVALGDAIRAIAASVYE